MNPQEPRMDVPVVLDARPITTPHKDLDHLPLDDKDFHIKDLTFDETPLKLHYRYKDNYLNHVDKIGLWESNLPKYQFPSVHVFPEIIHYCHENYDPVLKVVMSSDQKILFTITAKSINEMLQLQPGQDLTTLSIPNFLERFTKLSFSRSTQFLQTFISKEKYMPKDAPPYMSAFFFDLGRDITTMLSCILGSTTNEYIDEKNLSVCLHLPPINLP